MGVSSKTIHRDLAALSQLGFPLLSDVGFRGQKHWRLDQTKGLLQLQFTLEEAAALYLGRQFLEPLAGTYFFEGAQRAFEKIRTTLGEAALRHLEKLAAAFYHTTHGWTDYSGQAQRIDDLVRAIEDRRLTVITYQSLQSTEPVSHYDVHPYCLVWHKHALYLIAWSADHGEIRTFKVNRISDVEVQQLQFQRPAQFDPQQYLAGSFGIFQGDGPLRTVRVRFSRDVARAVGERRFHPSQVLLPQPDGGVIAQFELSSFEEVASWILSWGPHAQVLQPPELRQRVVAMLERTLAQYAPPSSPVAPRRIPHRARRLRRATGQP
jgi:proteasome accessory factor B